MQWSLDWLASSHDPHHCRCFRVRKSDILTYKTGLESLGFRETSLQLDQGQLFELVRSDGNGKQMHIRIMPLGQIESEIEPSPSYPFAHLNPLHSYSAHLELEQIFRKWIRISYKRRIRMPITCFKRVIVEPQSPTYIVTFVFVIIAVVVICYVIYRLSKKEDDSAAVNSS